ncbi:hypothetical protein M758_UG269000 [Ceratodon purpureus]|nr:hypothetical protein M758_UG269000 [Ceratodon purpureus]
MFHDKTKHFEVDWHFIRQKIEDKVIKVGFVPTTEQPVDILTKALGRTKFEICRARLNLKTAEEVQKLKILESPT